MKPSGPLLHLLRAPAQNGISGWNFSLQEKNSLSVRIWNRSSNDNSSITLETTVNHGKVFVSVKDHGTGIPKESLSKIWDRFYKIDASRGKDRKGTGLGLAIVKEIINAHKQNINVISTVGVGTEFIFTLEKAK